MDLNNSYNYLLRNKKTGHMNIGYTAEEVKAFLTSFSLKEKFEWYIWTEIWDIWQPVSAFQELLGNIHREMPDAPEFNVELTNIKLSSTNKETKTELKNIDLSNIPDLEIEGEASYDKRNFERVDKKLKVKVKYEDFVFQTYTLNLSEGGALLADNVPKDYAKDCTIQIKKVETNQAIEVKCEILEVNGKRSRIAFRGFEGDEVQKKFFYWLIS